MDAANCTAGASAVRAQITNPRASALLIMTDGHPQWSLCGPATKSATRNGSSVPTFNLLLAFLAGSSASATRGPTNTARVSTSDGTATRVVMESAPKSGMGWDTGDVHRTLVEMSVQRLLTRARQSVRV